ncbi:zinc metalloproteinase dpy-31 [Lingula anatina]|uniref:Metalloendopeptidase n=1 Tax=Lingula anatina TaxID=7574 RepID=A0A1S3HM35_LINAN|nr:zinc metalloproteinase dpy-31 [Lingula anatina]|eukprot:XP_013387072.1 zinc metalloproteinase dpy-31 [Lingula anatina]
MKPGVVILNVCVLVALCGESICIPSSRVGDKEKKVVNTLEKILLHLNSGTNSDVSTGKRSDENTAKLKKAEKELSELLADDKAVADDKSQKLNTADESEKTDKLSLDFDNIAQDKDITFKDVRLNTKADIEMSGKEKAAFLSDLEEYLHGQTLEQRMKVWEGMANLRDKMLEKKGGVVKKQLSTFNIEDNDLFEGDIVLDTKDINDIEDNLEQEKLAEDPNAILKTKVRALVKKLTSDDLNDKEEKLLQSLREAEKHTHSEKYKDAARKRDFLDDDVTEEDALADTLETVLLSTAKFMDARDERAADDIDKKMYPEEKWDMPIRYRFDGTHNEKEQHIIHLGIQLWENNTCVRFKFEEGTDHIPGDNIRFHKGKGCSSSVGEKSGSNHITLGEGCFLPARVAHEIGHTLGFWHEQSRPDRDKYVSVNTDILKDDKYEINFLKMSWKMEDPKGVEYDMSSVMHYGGNYFIKPGARGFTLVTKNPDMQKVIGQRFYLSFLDVKAVNYRYCSDTCSTPSLIWDKCEHEGYRDPKNCDQCRCPQGWTGKYCQDVDSGSCSDTSLIATTEPKFLTSPGYHDSGYSKGQYCAWLITAPEGMRVTAKFVGDFAVRSDSNLSCEHPFCQDWVEVRYLSLAQTGPRFCCNEAPEHSFRSAGNQMMVVFKSFLGDNIKGFKLEYKAERCGGCGEEKKDLEKTCSKIVKHDCSGVYYVKCGLLHWARCSRKRLDYCYKEHEFCCEGYKKVGSHCISDDARLELNELMKKID